MPPIQLETDAMGNIVTNPLTAYATTQIAGVALLLVIQYASSQEGIEKEDLRQQVQISLTPKQGLELAEALKTAGTLLLSDTGGTRRPS